MIEPTLPGKPVRIPVSLKVLALGGFEASIEGLSLEIFFEALSLVVKVLMWGLALQFAASITSLMIWTRSHDTCRPTVAVKFN